MVRYMKCPRCELNYIDAEKQEYCEVCLKELQGIRTDLDEIEEVEEEMPTELCPICGENMMRAGEKMCDECKNKADYESEEPDPEEDDEWREYLDDDTDDLDEDMEGLNEAFNGEFEGEFDEPEEEEDEYESEDEVDMEYVTGDEIYSLGDDDDDDDDDEDGDDF